VLVVQAVRAVVRLIRFLARHPVAVTVVLAGAGLWHVTGWPGLVVVVLVLVAALVAWRWRWPASFARWVARPARGWWRGWHYRRHWGAVMTIGRLAPVYQGRVLLPVLGKVSATRYTDRVAVKLVSGQSAADFAARAPNLAHGFGAMLCRVRTARPGALVLEFVRRDALADPVPALPVPAHVDLRALPVGRREDGQVWTVRLHGTHVLVAGATGAGKGSVLWSLIRAMLPLMAAGLVRVWAADPKLMELGYGLAIFQRYGRYAAAPEAIADMLEDAVAEMQDRAGAFAGKRREHTPTAEHPFTVIFVDEVAFLTAYVLDKRIRDRAKAALAILTTQGRALGYCVVAALQDPRKEVMSIRNLFPDRIAMRLDEPEQVDMVLGDGARDRGATADLIPIDPAIGAGVAFMRLETNPDPVRVRAAWVTDPDIAAMAAGHAPRLQLAEAGAA
jgi:S-DNA-T family DNA segregation ATPase FtsK/SpoIIIE